MFMKTALIRYRLDFYYRYEVTWKLQGNLFLRIELLLVSPQKTNKTKNLNATFISNTVKPKYECWHMLF